LIFVDSGQKLSERASLDLKKINQDISDEDRQAIDVV